MDVDKKIMEAEQQLVEVLNNSGLTYGIMILMLKDILRTLELQQQQQMIKEQGKEDTE